MSRLLKPSAELPLKLLAIDTIDDGDVPLQLLPPSLPKTSSGTATPLQQTKQQRPAPFTENDGWHHGGLNE